MCNPKKFPIGFEFSPNFINLLNHRVFGTYINRVSESIIYYHRFLNKEKDRKIILLLLSFGHFGDTPCIHDCIIIKLFGAMW
jgi:hypothetical protein